MRQLHFLLFFFFFTGISAVKTLPVQLIALLSLKESLVDPLDTLHSWDLSSDPSWCKWSGIKCDQHDQIIAVDLSNRNLSGTIPSSIRHLGHLRYLNLSTNAFEGPLPQPIFELRSLVSLDISHNVFNSEFPTGLSKLKWLSFLDAYNNDFNGSLPEDITGLQFLEHLHLGGSYFSGEIPARYCSFPRLKFLDLAGNLLTGTIPAEIGLLKRLERIEIGYNEFAGELPAQLSLLSNLTYLDVSSANLTGQIPTALGNLTKLETLLLFKNRLTGDIPPSLCQIASLKVLDLSFNQLTGIIPSEVSFLKQLNTLNLMTNELTGEIPDGIAGLPNLEFLSLWNNSLTGILPPKLGSNRMLQKLDVSSNVLSGPIPPQVCDGNRLVKLLLFSNRFSSQLPLSLMNCTALARIRIQNNFLNGSLPVGFGLSPNITFMDISKNNFSGSIPGDLSNAPKLEYLNISNNFFNGELPDKIWSSPSLQIFSAGHSNLIGKLPDFIGCQSLYKIELEGNAFTGSIPWDIGHCRKLISLNLRENLLTGIIPWEISTLPSITDVDLSHNFLTGTIPSNFDNSSTLENFNVSYNQLTGPIPSSGNILSILHPSSFIGNQGLCGSILKNPCRTSAVTPRDVDVQRKQQRKTAGAIVWIMATAFGVALIMLIAGIGYYHARYHRGFASGDRDVGQWKLTAFQRLNFTADDLLDSLSATEKILGMGSMGTVYKAEMPGGEIIAVKKLWGKQKEMIRRRKGVLAEVEVLGNVRHRNIVRLLGCCSNSESTMLLYEYMPNGSLDDLLHGNINSKGENSVADWLTRYKIAMGVAQGICYLHHDCDPVIVHRDLKPSNILLDAQMEARVADFGVAKLIQCGESMSVIAGSYGYIAPEYAYTLQVDEKSDIYSYGVVLMEIVCGKRSVDAEFGDGNNIVDWIRTKIKTKEGLGEVVDKNVGASCPPVREEMMLLLRVALLCTSRNPGDRPPMRDVVSMLLEAKPKRKVPTNGDFGGGNK